jgi:hypothetical protein
MINHYAVHSASSRPSEIIRIRILLPTPLNQLRPAFLAAQLVLPQRVRGARKPRDGALVAAVETCVYDGDCG